MIVQAAPRVCQYSVQRPSDNEGNYSQQEPIHQLRKEGEGEVQDSFPGHAICIYR